MYIQPLARFSQKNNIKFLFTDIDGTLTLDGRLPSQSYQALWELSQRGIQVIPITGRPAGWCDMIARFWPVAGVVGENGGLIFRHDGNKMQRLYALDKAKRTESRKKLNRLAKIILTKVPQAKIAADQFSRLFDLAIDFAEDVPHLSDQEIQTISDLFANEGAHAKVSNIHVNGWFGEFNKLSTSKVFCRKFLGFELAENLEQCLYVGDSPNDEPMFQFFKYSVGVANVRDFLKQMQSYPTFITEQREGHGFAELCNFLKK